MIFINSTAYLTLTLSQCVCAVGLTVSPTTNYFYYSFTFPKRTGEPASCSSAHIIAQCVLYKTDQRHIADATTQDWPPALIASGDISNRYHSNRLICSIYQA